MDTKMIIKIAAVLAGIVYAGLLVNIPFRTKKIKAECGQLLMPLKSDWPLRNIVIFILCAALIAVIPFRDFAPYLAVIFMATALIATWMSCQDFSNSGINGVYENMIISETTAIRYDEIMSLPTVAWEKDEDTTQVDFKVLEVIPKSGAKIQLIFPDEQVRNQALEVILKQCPRLAE